MAKAYGYATTDGSRPSSSNPAASSTSGSNGPRTIVFAPGAPNYNASCVLRLAIEIPWIPSGGVQGFDVTLVLGSDGMTALLPGVPTREELQVLHTRFFSFTLADAPAVAAARGGVAFFVSASSGPLIGPEVFLGVTTAGNTTFRPGPGGACASASGDAARAFSLVIDPTTGPCACAGAAEGCRFVLAVSCRGIPFVQPNCILSAAATLGEAP